MAKEKLKTIANFNDEDEISDNGEICPSCGIELEKGICPDCGYLSDELEENFDGEEIEADEK